MCEWESLWSGGTLEATFGAMEITQSFDNKAFCSIPWKIRRLNTHLRIIFKIKQDIGAWPCLLMFAVAHSHSLIVLYINVSYCSLQIFSYCGGFCLVLFVGISYHMFLGSWKRKHVVIDFFLYDSFHTLQLQVLMIMNLTRW